MPCECPQEVLGDLITAGCMRAYCYVDADDPQVTGARKCTIALAEDHCAFDIYFLICYQDEGNICGHPREIQPKWWQNNPEAFINEWNRKYARSIPYCTFPL